MLDFIKAESYANSNEEGRWIVSAKLSASTFAPSILQFASGIASLYPLIQRPPKFFMVKKLCYLRYRHIVSLTNCIIKEV